MNKIKILLITLILILLAVGVLYGVRSSVQTPIVPKITVETIDDEITSTNVLYISEMGDEAHIAYHSNNTATLTIIGSEYKDIQLNQAVSGSGAKYENIEQGLELWEKAPLIIIYKGDEELFSGKKHEVLAREKINTMLPQSTWVWIKTLNDIGPAAQNASIITPTQANAFTLTFTSEGNMSGTTDCNSFGGTYSVDEYNRLRFGSMMSTLMYCENSQEQEFISMLKESSVFITEDELILENTQTIYFKKVAE